MSPTGRVLLFKGRGFLSQIIRWQSRSRYSHAALQLRDGSVIEAWQFKGVHMKYIRDWRHIEAYDIAHTTGAQWHRIEEFAKSQLGKPYDYRGVFSFITRSRPTDNSRWFCSELVFAAADHAGIHLLERTSPGYVSPGVLALSPRLVRSIPLNRT